MTSSESPESPYPTSPLDAIGASGAFQIGDGFKFGQEFTDGLIKSMFRIPAPSPEDAIDLLREYLEKLPLDVLKAFKDLIPDTIEEQFADVVTAVNTIIESLVERPWEALLQSLKRICEFITNNVLAQCIAALNDDTGDFALNFVQGLFGIVENLWEFITNNPLAQCLAGLVDDKGNFLQNLLEGTFALLGGFWGVLLNNPLAQCLVEWFTDLFGSSGQFLTDFVAAVAHLLSELAELITDNTLLNGFKDFVETSGLLFLDVVKGLVEAVQQLMNLIGIPDPAEAIAFLQQAVTDVWELFAGSVAGSAKTIQDIIQAITEWIARIPLIGPLVGYLTQGISGVDFTPDFAGLAQWAERLLHTESKLPAQNLFGFIPGAVLGTVPVSNITNTTPNLLSQGSFGDSSNIDSALGWSWASSVNRSGNGGSARLDCASTSGTRRLYSNQNIPVAAGDRLGLSAFVNTTSFNGNSTSIQLSVVTFAGQVQKSIIQLASRGASNNAWGELTNRASLWEVPKAANTADQITSVQVSLSVGSSATAGVVHWDDISLWKGGLMQQSLVEYLISMTNGLLGGLSTATNTTPTPFTVTDPWNYTLQAGAAARQQANTGVANAATADGKAVTADGKAVTADGKAVVADGKAVAAQGTANTGVANAATADGKAVTINQRLFGQATTGTKLLSTVFPTTVGAVGSGIIMSKTGASSGSAYSANWGQVGQFNFLDDGFYNIPGVATSDLAYDSSNGKVGVRALNAGWYLVELGFQTNSSVQYTYWWSFTPAIYESSTGRTKYGASVVSARDTNFGASFSLTPPYAQSSFIVYMNPNDRVFPGYQAVLENSTGGGSANILFASPNISVGGTYFSVALLNRSLA